MTDIVTITPRPAVDLSTSVERIVPIHKLRGTSQRRDPGGGGINVARVIKRLGGDVSAIYPVGGATGDLLRRLLDKENVPSQTFAIAEEGGRKNVAIHLTVENFADRVQVTIEHSGSALPTAGLATFVKSTQSDAGDGLSKALEKTDVDRIEHETRDGKAYTILT